MWKDIKTAPKNYRVFIAKDRNNKEFECQFAPIPDGIGYYGFLEIPSLKEVHPTHWREKNAV